MLIIRTHIFKNSSSSVKLDELHNLKWFSILNQSGIYWKQKSLFLHLCLLKFIETVSQVHALHNKHHLYNYYHIA